MSSAIIQLFLNHHLEAGELRRQVAEIAAAGYEGLYAHARSGLRTPYFSESWWQALDVLVAACREHGLELWIWDDDYFPSGPQGGRVVWSDPSLAARDLRFTVAEVDWDGAGPVELDFQPGLLVRAFAVHDAALTDVTAWCGTRKQQWGRRWLNHRAYSPGINPQSLPHWRTSNDVNRFALLWTPPAPGRYTLVGVTTGVCSDDHPDLLRPEGIRRYLDLTHEEYARRLGSEFGQTIAGSFTDEPSPGAWLFPWSDRLPAEFRADHGYDLLDHLPHLALDLDTTSVTVRHHYRQTQHRLIKTHYVDQIGEWCHTHRLQHVGHLTRTEWLSLTAVWWPNELRCYQAMDIPMADPLGGSIGWPDAASYLTGLKVVASAAHLFGRERAGADCFAVINDEASLRDLKVLADVHLAMGINHFAVHGWSYSLDGPRKDEVPPSLGYQHSEFAQMPVLWEYVRTMSERLSGGEPVYRTAVLHPHTSLAVQAVPAVDWMHLDDEPLIHAVSEALVSAHRDFYLIDEVTLVELVAGTLPPPQQTTLPEALVLPQVRYVGEAAAGALARFAAGGGRVIVVGHQPEVLPAGAPAAPQPLPVPVEQWPELTPERLASLPGVTVTGEGAGDVFVLQRRRDGQELCFAFNRAARPFSGAIAGQPVWIAPGSSVLLSNDPALALEALPPPETPVVDLSQDWQVSFPANQLPLSFWHVAPPGQPSSAGLTAGATYDLMQRQDDPLPGDGPVVYSCRFMLTGEIADARLLIEDSTISGDWTLSLNGVAITGWQRERVWDLCNLTAPVGHALRTGSTPTLNVLEVTTTGPGRGLHEIPYLLGSFTARYRTAHLSFPFVEGHTPPHNKPVLQPWGVWGYPTFSGTVEYRRPFTVAATGDHVLDLGRVEDVAEVEVDGQPVATLAWEPYRCRLSGLAAGPHELVVRVTNHPGNRVRAAMHPAGLLGPVHLT